MAVFARLFVTRPQQRWDTQAGSEQGWGVVGASHQQPCHPSHTTTQVRGLVSQLVGEMATCSCLPGLQEGRQPPASKEGRGARSAPQAGHRPAPRPPSSAPPSPSHWAATLVSALRLPPIFPVIVSYVSICSESQYCTPYCSNCSAVSVASSCWHESSRSVWFSVSTSSRTYVIEERWRDGSKQQERKREEC